MFPLDSLMISGIQWALRTAITAAEAEMNDDTILREQLLEAEMRREIGEISDDEFGELEADLLARIREIKQRREGGSGPLAFGGAQPMETSADTSFQIEASVSGDFYGADGGAVTNMPPLPGPPDSDPVVPQGREPRGRASRATKKAPGTSTSRRSPRPGQRAAKPR